ncbi:unnamed protein product, partial [Polarella glacialis]
MHKRAFAAACALPLPASCRGLKAALLGAEGDARPRAVKVAVDVEGERLVCAGRVPRGDSLADTFVAVAGQLEESVPCLVLVHLAGDVPDTGDADWAMVAWTPGSSPVKLRMLCASSRRTLRSEFSSLRFKEHTATELDEVSLEQFLESTRPRTDGDRHAAMTQEELDADEVRKQVAIEQAAAPKMLAGLAALQVKVQPSFDESLGRLLAAPSGLVVVAQLCGASGEEVAAEVLEDVASPAGLRGKLPAAAPCYVMLCPPGPDASGPREGDEPESLQVTRLLLVSWLPDGAGVKARMKSSTFKASVVDRVRQLAGTATLVLAEATCEDDLDDSLLEFATSDCRLFQPLRQAYDLDLQNSELQQLGQPHQIPVAPVLQLLGDGDLEDEDLDVGSQLLEAGQVAGSGVSEVSAPDPSASPDAPSTPRHPLWVFDAAYLQTGQAYVCSVVLLLSGILCAAGGIGGGGIYVTVLMVAGGLSVRDAVPLSKSIVFFGSLSSLFLNLKKKTTSCGNISESVIDYNICRVVVPSALIGTYLGVLLNSMLPSLAILLALIGILVSMSWTVTRTALAQYKAEERLSLTEILGDDAENNPAVDLNEPELPRSGFEELKATGAEKGEQVRHHLRNQLARTDIALSLSMLLLIIAGSVFRHHAAACLAARTEQDHADTCQHPTVSFLGKGVLETWMDAPSTAAFINVFCFAGPLIFCCAVLTYSTVTLVTQANWGLGTACHFSLMAIVTGCLAGLVGIGGGLVFSPFFLLMGIEPSVA